jgi:hypothetical protein
MADAEDLKSSGPKGRAGSSPALGTNSFNSCARDMKPERAAAVWFLLVPHCGAAPEISTLSKVICPYGFASLHLCKAEVTTTVRRDENEHR